MCLVNKKKEVERLLARNSSYFVGYKVLVVQYDVSEKTLHSPTYYMVYKPGVMKSDNEKRKVCRSDEAIIRNGIHVYRSLKAARNSISKNMMNRVIVRVTGKREDLLAASKHAMVFQQVRLSKASYNKVTC